MSEKVTGDQLQVIAVGKVWDKVVDPAGRTGYIANDYMSPV